MRIARALVLCLLPSLATAQPVQVLHAFGLAPSTPSGALVEAADGSFYGTSATGIYRRAPDGQVTLAARADGAVGAILRGSDGALYGAYGGRDGTGAIFRFDPVTGDLRALHEFSHVNDGASPLGGLVEVGGQLYGVTRSGGPAAAPSVPSGTIFRLDPSTGAFTVLHAFSDRGATAAWVPWGPLALGPDGLLYGTTRFGGSEQAGTIYRLNPATGAFAIVHAMTVAEGIGPVGPLLLDSDGAFYGSAYAGDGSTVAGTIFRFDPATSQLQRVYSLALATDGSSPGPLVKAADGHLYGTADYGPVPQGSPRTPTFFRLRRTPAVSFETLRTFDPATTGRGEKVQLAPGTDGLLYGYAQTDGPTGTGTIYRFDPLAAGPPSDPLSFTVLHTFPPEAWWPSRPTLSADGFLYGTTRFGGATGRGRVYRLARETGAVTLLGTLPGGPVQTTSGWNSPLVQGPDGLLYGTSLSVTDTVSESRIVRVDPATGAASAAHERTDPMSASVQYPSGPLARLSGALYGFRHEGASPHVFRFDPQTNVVTDVVSMMAGGLWAPSSLLAATDGQLYLTSVFLVPISPRGFRSDAQLRRVNVAAGTVDPVVELGQWFIVSTPAQGPGATVYVGASNGFDPTVLLVDLQTNQTRPVCTIPPEGYVETLSVASDGTLFGTLSLRRQARFHCNPATGATSVEYQSPEIGRVAEPFTTVPIDGLSYGAASTGGPAGGGTLFRVAPTLTPPALDSDTDGLSNIWETAYGLDPFSSAGAAGAAGDPDHDGRTNAQELAEGTHPRGTVTRYFAEGATGAFFHTRFDLGNAQQATPAIVRVRFLTDAGVAAATDVIVPPSSHVSIDPATLPGLANATFSTIVEADAAVAVDRTMSWDATGYGSHLETGLVAPSTTWYFAEGSTSGDFWLFYLLQNPGATAVTATVRFLRPSGAPIERTYTLPPLSRTTIPVDLAGPELASTDVSAVITATAPIVAERAMYLSRPGQPFGAGHESAGVTAPALDWFLAEGATGAFFDLFVLIANPGSTDAAVAVEYLLVGGGSLTKTYTVPANSRTTIWVDDEQLPAGSGQRPLANVAVSMTVRSTNSVPIIVERAMWWPGPAVTANYWYEAHNSPGATTTATRWITGGGEAGGADNAETYVLIANTTTTPGRARVTLLLDSGAVDSRDYDLPAKSRTNVPIGQDFFSARSARFSVVVESLGVPAVPIVVERATYASPGGVTWAAGGNALAAPLP